MCSIHRSLHIQRCPISSATDSRYPSLAPPYLDIVECPPIVLVLTTHLAGAQRPAHCDDCGVCSWGKPLSCAQKAGTITNTAVRWARQSINSFARAAAVALTSSEAHYDASVVRIRSPFGCGASITEKAAAQHRLAQAGALPIQRHRHLAGLVRSPSMQSPSCTRLSAFPREQLQGRLGPRSTPPDQTL